MKRALKPENSVGLGNTCIQSDHLIQDIYIIIALCATITSRHYHSRRFSSLLEERIERIESLERIPRRSLWTFADIHLELLILL